MEWSYTPVCRRQPGVGYISITVRNTTAAVQTFTACIADINVWMSASRLRLNPAKTHVIWLGSSQLVSQIDIRDIPVLWTHVQPVEQLAIWESSSTANFHCRHTQVVLYSSRCYYIGLLGTRHGTMSILLLLSPATSPSCSLIVNRNCQNISPSKSALRRLSPTRTKCRMRA